MKHIELDRIHRVPGRANAAAAYSRDVLCRVHFYKCKEEILLKARGHGLVDYKYAQIMLYSDLSRQTLAKWRSLRPLTKALVEAGLT